jgi:hypothetical protein
MSVDFPINPSIGTTYSISTNEWIYDGYGWKAKDISSNYVESLNGVTGSIGLSAGIDITIQGSGKTLTIASPTLYGISGNIYASNLATGLLYGGIISINAGNTAQFDITAGRGQIHASGSTYTSGPSPTFQYVNWPGQTGITLTYLATSDTTWIYVDSAGIIQQRSTYYTDQQLETTIIIGQLVHPSRTFIDLARTNPNVAYATDKQYEQFIRSFGPIKVSGHTISANGANLKLNRTSGTAFSLGRNWINDTDNPSVVSDGAYTDCIFYRYYRGVTAGSFITVPDQTAIDPTKYDNGSGTLQTVPGGKYTIQRLFYYPNTPTLLGVYYGRGEYTSLADAAANINFENFTEIENTKTNAIFVAYLLVKSGATDLTNTSDALILQAGSFRSTTSGGGSVSLTLDDLTDVIITSPQNYQVLTYVDGVTGWENKSVTSLPLVSSLRGLTGAVGLTNGSGIGLSISGNTLTVSNTGVLSVNGGTGAITNVAKTNVNNNFTASQSISAFGGSLTVTDSDTQSYITLDPASTSVSFLDVFGGGSVLSGGSPPAFTTVYSTLPSYTTVLAGLTGTQTFTGTNTFSSLANFNAGISSAGGTFSALTRFTAGISASGATLSSNTIIPSGSTLTVNGNFVANGNVNLGDAVTDAITVTGLLAANGGLSAAGGTFSALTRFTAGISASGGMTLAGGTFNLDANIDLKRPSNSTTTIQAYYSPAPGFYSPTSYISLSPTNGITFGGGLVNVPGYLNVDTTSLSVTSGTVPLTVKGSVTPFPQFANMTDWINGSGTILSSILVGGGFSGPASNFSGLLTANAGISAAGGTFSALTRFTAGISASGGVTFAGTLQGSTATFTGLVTSSVGFSGAASQITATTTNSSSTFYPVFVLGTGNRGAFIDSTVGPLSYIPSTSTLKSTNLDLGNGALIISPIDVTSNDFFYFIASNGIYLQDQTLVQLGDVAAALQGTVIEVLPPDNKVKIYNTSSSSTLLEVLGGLSVSNGVTFNGTVSSDTGYRITSSAINAQTGTTYTLLESDNGKILTFSNASTTTVTVPTALPIGFNCTAIQLGAGQVGFTAASGVTLNSYGNQYKLIGQHASASIIEYTTNIVNLSGNLIV